MNTSHINKLKNIPTATAEIKEAWQKYLKNLFNKDHKPEDNSEREPSGPPIMESQVTHALSKLKTQKTPGENNIHEEVLKRINPRHLCKM